MIEGELQPTVGLHYLPLVVHPLGLSPPKAGTGHDEGPSQGLGHVAGVYVAAHYPRHHWPEGEVVVLGQDQDADVLAVPHKVTEVRGSRVASEAAAHDEHLLLELRVR